MTTNPVLWKMLKEILHTEEKNEQNQGNMGKNKYE
jgi:hypothetical protein